MANWKAVREHAPEIAQLAQARIEATGLGLLATLRADSGPRISGIEPMFAGDELWLAMMPNSLKARDLRRDPRFCLHNATTDKDVTEGDVKITGRAVFVDDDAARLEFARTFMEHTGSEPPEFELFRADVTEVATIRPGGNVLHIDSWREGQPPKHVERE